MNLESLRIVMFLKTTLLHYMQDHDYESNYTHAASYRTDPLCIYLLNPDVKGRVSETGVQLGNS